MANELCNDGCTLQLDVTQFEEIYDLLDTKVRDRLNTDYDCKKINGTTYAATWASMMGPAVGQILGSLVSIQTKETAADRCVKEEQCASSKAATIRNDETADEQIRASGVSTVNDTCRATADCRLKKAQEEEIGLESSRRDCTTTIQTDEIKVESSRRDLATEVDSVLKKVQATEILVESDRKEKLTEAEHAIKVAQAAKVNYEKTYILPASVALTKRQICGFDDNIDIKVMESKWSYNAMITASGMGGDSGTFVNVDTIDKSCSVTTGTCISPKTPCLDLIDSGDVDDPDDPDGVKKPTATPEPVQTPVCRL